MIPYVIPFQRLSIFKFFEFLAVIVAFSVIIFVIPGVMLCTGIQLKSAFFKIAKSVDDFVIFLHFKRYY